MASVSRLEAPVLHFALRPHVEVGAQRSLLWPAWAYRVVAPAGRERNLNVLQKAVLGLCRAGFRRAEEIGKRLHLHRDLVAWMLLELNEQGWLGRDGAPTEEGIEVLLEETLEPNRFVAGYVFQDPFSGELWPRFTERIEYAETEPGENGFPMLVLGTPGNRRRVSPFVMPSPEAHPPPPPDAREILRATRRHRAAQRRARAMSPWDEDDAGEPVRAVLVDRISMIEDVPRLVYLSTSVYLPKRPEDGADWHACDPFGLGASPWLRRAIEGQLDRHPRLSDTVRRLFEGAIGGRITEHRQILAELREQAALDIHRALPPVVRGSPLHESLLEFMHAAAEAELLGEECPDHKLRGALVCARVALEKTLLWIGARHPAHGVWRCLYAGDQPVGDEAYVRGIYEAAAHVVGFSTPIAEGLASVKPTYVKWVAERPEAWRLRPMIVTALLCAREDAAHPLRRAARKDPGLLDELEAIVRWAGQGAHASGQRISMASVDETRKRLIHVITLLSDVRAD